ncbi:MAG: hypothetical protein E6713_05750 [Sporomusaceae bacterium]|nr:hypothetical protein [Sporomusaceae bacterium]
MSLVNKCSDALLHKNRTKKSYSHPMFLSPSSGKWINVDENENIYVLNRDEWRFIYPSSPEWQIYLTESKQQHQVNA